MAGKSTLPLLLAGGAAVAVLAGQKKPSGGGRGGIKVSKACEIDVLDEQVLHNVKAKAFQEFKKSGKAFTPFDLADYQMKKLAPKCPHFPKDAVTYSSFAFYTSLVSYATLAMLRNNLITFEELKNLPQAADYGAWLNKNRNRLLPPMDELPEIKSNQVGFSADLSDYVIGPSWKIKVFEPFLLKEVQQGRLATADDSPQAVAETAEQAVDRFIQTHTARVDVLEGVPIHFIADEDTPAVNDFIKKMMEMTGHFQKREF